MGTKQVEHYLTNPAVHARVAYSIQNQVLNAIVFMHKEVLKIDLPWLNDVTLAKKPEKLPVVYFKRENRNVLAKLDGTYWIMAHRSGFNS